MSKHFVSNVIGPNNAPAIVLLHSIATSSELWLPQLPIWTQYFRVITIDLPGHGKSAALEATPSLETYADGIVEVLEQRKIARAGIVGISLGGMVAQAVALQHPERVSALVLAHAGACTNAHMESIWQHRIADFEAGGFITQVAPTLERWFTPAFAVKAPLTLEWVAGMIRSTTPDGYIGAIRAIQKLNYLEQLVDIRAPTMVIAGEHDKAITPDTASLIANKIQGSRYEMISGAAHISNVEAPIVFTELVGAFLQRSLAT